MRGWQTARLTTPRRHGRALAKASWAMSRGQVVRKSAPRALFSGGASVALAGAREGGLSLWKVASGRPPPLSARLVVVGAVKIGAAPVGVGIVGAAAVPEEGSSAEVAREGAGAQKLGVFGAGHRRVAVEAAGLRVVVGRLVRLAADPADAPQHCRGAAPRLRLPLADRDDGAGRAGKGIARDEPDGALQDWGGGGGVVHGGGRIPGWRGVDVEQGPRGRHRHVAAGFAGVYSRSVGLVSAGAVLARSGGVPPGGCAQHGGGLVRVWGRKLLEVKSSTSRIPARTRSRRSRLNIDCCSNSRRVSRN
mmetsp:Transcript_43301/g.106348  ORF Transcript_43301/g.106348 Transcript_43301/m.106348 type:complete len:306 (-) Transcript_43301:127-1044(-)